MDIFDDKNLKPMLIGVIGDAFDSPDYIYELKLDGVRCLAYLDSGGTELRNKRNIRVSRIYPELTNIHKQAKKKCILDGELIVMNQGKPDFEEIKRRALMSNKMRIELAAAKLPVSITVFDILYLDGTQTTNLPLMERKKLLEKTVKENESIAISRYIEQQGVAFYQLAEQNDLEGIVAKRKDSKYYFDKRTKDWIKIKNFQDDDFVISGYIHKEEYVASIILSQYRGKSLVYKGHVTLGISSDDFARISGHPKLNKAPLPDSAGRNEGAVWLEPTLVCTVQFMDRSEGGFLRHPVFKGLRNDKDPKECMEK